MRKFTAANIFLITFRIYLNRKSLIGDIIRIQRFESISSHFSGNLSPMIGPMIKHMQ